MIYFIEMEKNGFIKIGYTTGNAERRMAQLQTGQPLKLKLLGTIPGEREGEIGLHREFEEFRINGEWFIPNEYLITIIDEMIDNQTPWYYCRKLREFALEREWKEAFKFNADTDTSAYDDVVYFDVVNDMMSHLYKEEIKNKDEKALTKMQRRIDSVIVARNKAEERAANAENELELLRSQS